MSRCCSSKKPVAPPAAADPCAPPQPCAAGADVCRASGLPIHRWFADMVPRCLAYAQQRKAAGARIVGILCEFTPREVIMAAGGVPVCLCGGSAEMIPPAEDELPANLCPLIKSTYGYSVERANPFLEMADLVVAETTCDGKKKMYELLARRHAMHVLELPQKPDDPDAFEHWLRELQKLRAALEARFGVTVSDDALRRAVRDMNRERGLRRALAQLMTRDDPPFTGRELLDMKSLIACIPADLAQYEAALRDDRAAPAPGRAAAAKRPVRVLLTGVPLPHGAERPLEIIESHGGLVVCQESCSGLKPLLDDVDPGAPDILRAIAEKYFHLPCSVMTRNTRRLDLLRRLAAEYRAECIVDLVWHACLTYDVESLAVRELAGELGVPYLRIETDYSPSDTARIGVRVEALFETVTRNRPGGQAK